MALTGLKTAFGGALALAVAACGGEGTPGPGATTPVQAGQSAAPAAEQSTGEQLWDDVTDRAAKAKDAMTGYFTGGDACDEGAETLTCIATSGFTSLVGSFTGRVPVAGAAASGVIHRGTSAATEGTGKSAKEACASTPVEGAAGTRTDGAVPAEKRDYIVRTPAP